MTVTVPAIWARSRMRGAIYRPRVRKAAPQNPPAALLRGPSGRPTSEAVRGASGTQREEYDDERREGHHAHLASHDLDDDAPLLPLRQPPNRLGPRQVALG